MTALAFDSLTELLKIHLETQAKLYIQAKIKESVYNLVWSYILDYENGRNPYEEKRRVIAPWKRIASEYIAEESEEILTFAESLSKRELKHTMLFTLHVLYQQIVISI